MAKTYRSTLKVRGYELDSFGHVNHAVYVSYMEHARWEMLAAEGITLKKFQEWKRFPVIAELEAKYLRPTYIDDTLEVQSKVIENTKTSFIIQQTIYKGDVPVLLGKVRVVTVDETGRPAAMPSGIDLLWTQPEEGSGD
ncbi:MAG: acyl-CoA thioesterase [Methylotenera sp.]|nr:acyl-CoA thioesterase [Oligoflexia bacterium]